MVLRQTMFLFMTCALISPVRAMNIEENNDKDGLKVISQPQHGETQSLDDWEVINPSKLQPVTVRMWKNTGGSNRSEHISIETSQHYMSLHPISENVEEKGYLCYKSPCFAPLNSAMDQLIQDKKLNGKSETWPCETITLNLVTASMNKMWETLLKDSSPKNLDEEITGRVLKNVHYSNEEMRKEFQRYIERRNEPSNNDTDFYFTNTSLVLGLLIKGKIFGENIYYINNTKYFGNALWSLLLPSIHQNPGDRIENNFYSRTGNLHVGYISGLFPDVFKRQELIRIEKNLEHYKIPFLPAPRRAEIIKMVDEKKSQDEIDQKISEFNTIFHNQQKYSSLTGWINYSFYRGEW